MPGKKLKSFTLSEMLVVLIITAIVVGIGFSVLRLVQREVVSIERNFEKRTEISLFHQRIALDFDRFQKVVYNKQAITLFSDKDTIHYQFYDDYMLRNADTIKLKVVVEALYFQGDMVKNGFFDAVKLNLGKEIPGYYLFLNTSPVANNYLNKNGF